MKFRLLMPVRKFSHMQPCSFVYGLAAVAFLLAWQNSGLVADFIDLRPRIASHLQIEVASSYYALINKILFLLLVLLFFPYEHYSTL